MTASFFSAAITDWAIGRRGRLGIAARAAIVGHIQPHVPFDRQLGATWITGIDRAAKTLPLGEDMLGGGYFFFCQVDLNLLGADLRQRLAGHVPVQAMVMASTAPSRFPSGRNMPYQVCVFSCFWPHKNA